MRRSREGIDWKDSVKEVQYEKLTIYVNQHFRKKCYVELLRLLTSRQLMFLSELSTTRNCEG